MATSGSRNWITTRDDIIYSALRKLGVKKSDNPPTVGEIQDATFALNSLVSSWQNDDVHLWTVAEELLPLTADTLSYSLGSTVLEIQTPFFRRGDSDSSMSLLAREEYQNIPDKKTSGDPTSIYMDYQLSNPTAYVWPVPNNTTSLVVGTDALYYLCIKDHTSAAASRPITGADYATYWQAVSTATATAWVTATAYYSDVVRYSKVLRLQDFDAASDNPDFPARWIQALIYGLASDLAPEFGMKDILGQRALFEYGRARRLNFDNTDLRVIVSRR
jgi:hypothetical protein